MAEAEAEAEVAAPGEVLYEIRRHASESLLSPNPSHHQTLGGSRRRGLLSYLSLQGVTSLKEKWNEYSRGRTPNRRMTSLFVSPDGEHVAVAAGNRIVILRKEDDYKVPCGVFINNDRLTIFTSGAWLEPQGILGAVDDLSTLYFIKANGDEIARRTRKQLKLPAPIIGLIGLDELKKFSFCGFCIFASDGSVHQFDVNQEPIGSAYLVPAATNNSTKSVQWPKSVACLDFDRDRSLVVLVGDSYVSSSSEDHSGVFSLYVLHMDASSEINLVAGSSACKGLFSSPKDHVTILSSPKVAISPHGQYVATLDLAGFVKIFKLNFEQYAISAHSSPEKYLTDIIDISWWANHILILANKSGSISMYNIVKNTRVSVNDSILCKPIIERVKCRQGFALIMESGLPKENISTTEHVDSNLLDNDVLSWSLLSFSEVSISEMYSVLINDNRYQEALEFASRYCLDTDEVFKGQWLYSNFGIYEIDSYLSKIKDLDFVLSECVNRVGSTEHALRALISFGLRITDQYKISDSDDINHSLAWDMRVYRLRLLQCRDILETFVGINMGRFSPEEYKKFRSVPLTETAIVLAGSGKVGALNLLFKRHPYTLSPNVLQILSSVPETVPVQSYSQLLPGNSPPPTVALRDGDWVECKKMVSFIEKLPSEFEKGHQLRTEIILKLSRGFIWPSDIELTEWYKKRARDIDNLSGQLDNSLSLVEIACRKGIGELQQFLEDISCLHWLIYSGHQDDDFSMSLAAWEQLPEYEKFKIMLKGVKEDTLAQRLRERAIPFMRNRADSEEESYMVRWLKDVASENQLAICLAVIENGCGDSPVDGMFKDHIEMVEAVVHCLYVCSSTDQWSTMESILLKLHETVRGRSAGLSEGFNSSCETQHLGTYKFPKIENSTVFSNQLDGELNIDMLEKRINVAEGHVEVGRMLAYYQVPKPMSFFLDAQSDEKSVKQLLRLILSKFGRRQPGRSDSDWATLWRDMQSFREKAFPFLDSEYMLTEFVRGLLKAGKFSLARNYLRGTSSVTLGSEKAEHLVIQAAREYFFSASSLSSNEIWKAKECLSLIPNSRNAQAESDIIDALTIRLPNLGVTLLPMQFKQIQNPMEIIKMAITSQTGAYLNVEELIEIAKLLGLRSNDDIASVEEAIAREAAVAGDLQLAFDLCLILTKKGHGLVWDLCAAIARGPHLDNMDTSSRKQLLGFALCHCDEESIGELLNAWKEFDVRDSFEKLMISTETNPPNFSVQNSSIIPLPVHSAQGIFDLRDSYSKSGKNDEDLFNVIKETLSKICTDLPYEEAKSWESLLEENKKLLSFAALELPWLLELCESEEFSKEKDISSAKFPSRKHCISTKMQAVNSIIYWLVGNGVTPKDDLIASLAKSIMESPVTEEDDVLGCSFLLNLMDPFNGVELIEEELKRRGGYQEMYSIMNVGMVYSSLNNAQKECHSPDQRRKLLLHKFHEKLASFASDDLHQIDKVQSTFWREWKAKLEEQKQLADQARALKQIIPGIEAARFLSGDIDYIKKVVLSFVDSVKLEKKHILKEAVKLADTYGLQRNEVLLRFFGCALVSEHWENRDILAEISDFREDIVRYASKVIDMIYSDVYPQIDGHNKRRLSYVYNLLSACYSRLKWTEDPEYMKYLNQGHSYIVEPFQYYKVLEQECQRASFIDGLNFKNVAGLDDLNFEHFNEEICKYIRESTVEALADIVQSLVNLYDDSQAKGLISKEGVSKHYILALLASLEGRNEARSTSINPDELQELIGEIEQTYDSCKKYIQALLETDISYIIGRYCTLCFPFNFSRSLPHEIAWKDSLVVLVGFWVKLVDDVTEKLSPFETNRLSRCLKSFKRSVINDEISVNQGWDTVSNYIKFGLINGLVPDISCFCKSMIFACCPFETIAEAYYGTEGHSDHKHFKTADSTNLLELYGSSADALLSGLIEGLNESNNLHNLLSSLSKFTGNYTEDLKIIRSKVWEKVSNFSEDMRLESQFRVYALQLLQCITGKNLKTLPPELTSQVEPWESWDEPFTSNDVTTERADAPSSITSTLVALKSTQLVAAISPHSEITPENLSTVESAVSCFLHFSESASSVEDLNVLQAVLEEWEQLFLNKEEDHDQTHESPKDLNNWSSDEWDEGWETLPEDLGSMVKKQDGPVSVHPLHSCWTEIMKRLVGLHELRTVVNLLDQSLSKPIILLDEDEAHSLYQIVVEVDCFMALKLLLLLPYEGLRFQCLQLVENKMREGTISNESNTKDYELLALILSSGIVGKIANEPAYRKVFSSICYLAGNLARICQNNLLVKSKGEKNREKGNDSLLFVMILLPYFVSELICGGQHLVAGAVVSRWMHTHTSLGLVDVVGASLRRYLDGLVVQVQREGDAELGLVGADNSFSSISFTVSRLRSKLVTLLQSALLALPDKSGK
ncbi:MAG2-interacting protein 2 [Ananas comosus]|uniref:MAG2-interacting protein 2 n=1 Tax=Ananas comosus TaxID=4615 RepID=A0A6P5GY05_ANACO|nr:MAG2-interacting protein 2 [Ananas comosus]